jgi:hypothetical protein
MNVTGLQELENWFSFWHFHVKQWGGFMIHVIFSSLIPIFHPTLSSWHVYTTPLKMMVIDIYYVL